MRLTKKKILEVLDSSKNKILSIGSIARHLGIKKKERAKLKYLLYVLEKEGKIVRIPPNRFAIFDPSQLLKGKIQRFKEGYGFLLKEDGKDIFIPPPFMKGALSGDEVLVRIIKEKQGSKPEGRVVKILRRERTEFIGTYIGSKKGGVIIPDDITLPREIAVPKGGVHGAKDGDKVIFHLIHGRRNTAEIIEVLGSADDSRIDVIVVIKKYGLQEHFPDEVEEEAKRIRPGISKRVISGRLDLTNDFIFTIDPDEAKDFDDAISIEKYKKGYKLGVHIADVSHYVKVGTFIDSEARDRGTSVYLIDTVIPMLPHMLSGNICSLMPGKKRLTISIFITFDNKGKVIETKFEKSLIKSKAKLTYREAQMIIEDEKLSPSRISIFEEKILDIIREKLLIASELASKIRDKRWQRGSLDFDLPEPEIILLPTGGVADVKPAIRLETHRIIEDFMIIANESVARYLNERDIPTIYRIHEPPKPENIREFLILAENILGISIPVNYSPTPKILQKILEEAKGKEEEPLLNYILLRSLMRARYSVENKGHFGLATPLYLHFTSPIRRYPDLMVHRILKNSLSGKARIDEKWIEYLEDTASLSSMREERAEACEFELIDLKKLEFMKDKLGEVFEGIITHLTPNGFFVEIKSYLTEGFVSLDTLGRNFTYIPDKYLLREKGGKRRTFKIGQKVKVVVVRVNKSLKRLDFVLID